MPWDGDVVRRLCGYTLAIAEQKGMLKAGEIVHHKDCGCELGFGLPPKLENAN